MRRNNLITLLLTKPMWMFLEEKFNQNKLLTFKALFCFFNKF